MGGLPKTGLYTSKESGFEIYVEAAFGDDPQDFYLVHIIDEASRGDPEAAGDELTKPEWEALVTKYGLVHEG